MANRKMPFPPILANDDQPLQRWMSDVYAFLVDGGGGLLSPLTTKGDIWGFSTTDARIPVGTDGQVLVADSTQALGVKWATASSGGNRNYAIWECF